MTLKLPLVAPVSDPSVAARVNPVPALVGTRFENVAMPPTAPTVVVDVPLSTPPMLIAMETLDVSDVSRLPNWSCTRTLTAGVIACPAMVLDGCWEKTSLLATPAFTVNALLVPVFVLAPMPVAVSVKLPVLVIVTLSPLRTPFVNEFVVIGAPTSVPVEVRFTLFPLPVKLVTVLLKASWAVMVMLKAVPAVCGLLMFAKVKWSNAPAVKVTWAVWAIETLSLVSVAV